MADKKTPNLSDPEHQIRQLEAENTRLRQQIASDRQRTAERNLRSILDNLPSMVGYWDRGLCNRFANHAYFAWFGIDPATMPGRHMREILGEERYRLNLPYIEAALRGEPQQFERAISSPDGKTVRHSLTNYIPDIVAGEVLGFYVLVTDITAAKQVEAALEATQVALRIGQERLRRGQQFANIGTWEWTIETGDLFWSERIAPLFGYPVGELSTSYENFLNAIHPEDRQAVTDAVAACVEHNAPYDIEHRVVWPDGTVRWLSERGAVSRDEQGKPLKMLGVVQDIDDRKRAELALAERERLLREAQKLARIGNWSADLATGKLLWSDEIYRIFGHEPGSFAPSVEAFHATVHPEDRTLVRESEKRAEQSGRHDVVHRIVRPDGEIRYVHELAQMQMDAAGNPSGLTGTVQDVTERMMFERELVAAREAADRANAAKSEFLSRMSHELRTPLNAIIGFGQMLALPGKSSLSEQQADNVQEILKAGQHLLVQVNEVLDLARIESGRIELSLEALPLEPLIKDCIAQVQPLAAARGIAIAAQLDEVMALQGDHTRVKQVLLNLLSNAIKYNRDGGQIHVAAVPDGECLRIEVTDTGRGIAPEKRERLFKPFERLESSYDGIEGTGIGLALVKRLIEAMGGEIGVDSKPNVGSTFWFVLPTAKLPSLPAMPPQKVGPGETAKKADIPAKAQHRVLYIEDNPANLKLIRKIIGLRPEFDLLDATNAELGLEIARRERPDLILLDINLPGMDGFAAIAQLQAWPETATIPVVAVTANAMKNDIDRGKSAGFADYLTKPIDIAGLHHILDTLPAGAPP